MLPILIEKSHSPIWKAIFFGFDASSICKSIRRKIPAISIHKKSNTIVYGIPYQTSSKGSHIPENSGKKSPLSRIPRQDTNVLVCSSCPHIARTSSARNARSARCIPWHHCFARIPAHKPHIPRRPPTRCFQAAIAFPVCLSVWFTDPIL